MVVPSLPRPYVRFMVVRQHLEAPQGRLSSRTSRRRFHPSKYGRLSSCFDYSFGGPGRRLECGTKYPRHGCREYQVRSRPQQEARVQDSRSSGQVKVHRDPSALRIESQDMQESHKREAVCFQTVQATCEGGAHTEQRLHALGYSSL